MSKLNPTVPGADFIRRVSLRRRLCIPLCSYPGEGEWYPRFLSWAASKGTGHSAQGTGTSLVLSLFSLGSAISLSVVDPDGRLDIRALAPQDSLHSVEISGLGGGKWDGAFNGRWFLVRVAVRGWENEHWESSLGV